ncbi:MAG: DegT/DnrJ/EryC1/StrS family aminotransferase [Candidatus Eisenbacteria bacterium]|nr:DegT/DnrJ/EryC1/StrS family aminotransferase [Candidatus Eisenbacteria bacterium]
MDTHTFIPWAKPDFWGHEQRYLIEALTSTWISGGAFVDRLERDFAAYHHTRFALTASNGTTALHMAFLALGVGPGDEVIVPGFGFLAAANMTLLMGATPVFAEVNPRTWCLDQTGVEARLSPRTRVIVPVHTYGNVCDMGGILDLAGRRGVAVVEDAAEALASRYDGRLAGTMGVIGSFSFQATKTITTGEGGMAVTDDDRLSERMALYRSHGMLRKVYYWHEVPGHNFRLTNLQAALGVAQMEKLDDIIGQRRRVHGSYLQHLSRVNGVIPQHFLPAVDPVVWAIAVRLDPAAFPQGRDAVIAHMKEARIETRPGFYAPSQMPHLYDCPPLPVSEEIGRQVISLPTYPTLQEADIVRICDALATLRR